MKKMFGMKLVLALVLVGGILFSACDNGNDEKSAINEEEKPDTDNGEELTVGGEIVARMTTVNSELTFYENGTVELKEDTVTKSVSARAVTANAASSSGTYTGDVMQDNASISLTFTSGERTGNGTAKIAERDDASNISMDIGSEHLTLERIQTLVTAWRSSGKTVYFYNDDRAMQVINDGDNITCHPLVYTGNAGKDGTVSLALLDSSDQVMRSNDGPVYKPATISDSTMTYNGDTYTKIDDDRTLATAWRANTEEDGINFIETMYFYDDGTFMIVMNKKLNDQITNGFAGTYTGDTTKDESVSATIAEFAEMGALPGMIENNKLTITAPMNITYDRIN